MKPAKRAGRGWCTTAVPLQGLEEFGCQSSHWESTPRPQRVCAWWQQRKQVKKRVCFGFWGLCGPSSLLSVLPGLSWCQIGFCPATCSFAGLFLGCTRSVSLWIRGSPRQQCMGCCSHVPFALGKPDLLGFRSWVVVVNTVIVSLISFFLPFCSSEMPFSWVCKEPTGL